MKQKMQLKKGRQTMILIEILEKISDAARVDVFQGGALVTFYDGKNSIDSIFNNCIIDSIYTVNNILCINILE